MPIGRPLALAAAILSVTLGGLIVVVIGVLVFVLLR